jgi:hypothetical protein
MGKKIDRARKGNNRHKILTAKKEMEKLSKRILKERRR